MGARLPAVLAVFGFLAGCASPRLTLPSGPGAPLDNFQTIFDEATSACAAVRTLTGELQLSGRVAGQRLRGRALVGIAGPDSLRLEGLAPFGSPAFILAATGGKATLFLPRDNRVLRRRRRRPKCSTRWPAPRSRPATCWQCFQDVPWPIDGPWAHARSVSGWRSISKMALACFCGAVNSGWTIIASSGRGWRIEYVEWAARFPSTIHLVSTGDPARVDLNVRVAEIEANVALGSDAFSVNVPPDAEPITLEELRESGPLRGAPGEATE